MPLTEFEVSGDGVGIDRLVLDGQDVTSLVRRVTVDMETGQLTKLYVELTGRGSLRGSGIVTETVSAVDASTLGPLLAEWLGQQDPGDLESIVLKRDDFGKSFATSLMELLQEKARNPSG